MGILEKIAEIEAEMKRTQKNKVTRYSSCKLMVAGHRVFAFKPLTHSRYHLGLLKAKLAKYRTMLLEPVGKAGPKVSLVLTLEV